MAYLKCNVKNLMIEKNSSKDSLPRPFSSSRFIPGPIRLVQVGDIRDQWVIGIRVSQH